MKRILFLGLILFFLVIPASASASIDPSPEVAVLLKIPTEKPVEPVKPLVEPVVKEPELPEPVIYTVIEGDSLVKIAEEHEVEWQRLWAKNTHLTNPDILNVGDKITIPFPDEELSRPIPEIAPTPIYVSQTASYAPSYGNTYSYGFCTWFVKNALGWVRNGWGNASDWAWRARAEGFTVSNTPRVGAVAQTSAGYWGHVAVVIGVGNGTVQIQEMNYNGGWGVVSYRTANTWEFVYIY